MTDMVVVSGGSGGIGRSLCIRLAEAGFRPIVGYSINQTAAISIANQTNGIALALDVRDPDMIETSLNSIKSETGNVVGVILAASPAPCIEPIFKHSNEQLENQWATNVVGSLNLLSVVIKRFMRPQKSGWVVGVLSEAMGLDNIAAKSMGGYIIAKYGLLGLLKVIEAEYSWLKVHHIEPGYTETPMLEVFDDRFLHTLRQSRPNGRFDHPDDVSARILEMIMKEQS